MKKRILTLLLAFLVMAAVVPFTAYTQTESQAAEDGTTDIWDTLGESEEICLIGFLDKDNEQITFIADDGSTTAVAAEDCPEYLILRMQWSDLTEGTAALYWADALDLDFYDEVLSYYPYIEADYVTAAVSAQGLYARVGAEESVTLYADPEVMTDAVSVAASMLAGEYVVEEFRYDYSDTENWFMKLTPDDTWPQAGEGYTWVSAWDLTGLSLTATQTPSEDVLAQGMVEGEAEGTCVTVSGLLPVGADVSIIPVAVQPDDAPNATVTYGAFDIKILRADGSQWQYALPTENGQPVQADQAPEPLDVTLSAGAMGLGEGDRVAIHHTHDGMTDVLGIYTVENGLLSFQVTGFSVITVQSVSTDSAAVNGVIYLDLNAGGITIDGSKNYIGYRFDGSATPKQFSGTVQEGQAFYIYQSYGTDAANTGLITAGDGTQQLVLPDYTRVEGWGDYITDNTDVDEVIRQWSSRASGRTATANWIKVVGYSGMDVTMTIDNLWSSHQVKGQGRQSGGISFVVSGSASGAKLNLQFKGDNRFGNIYYQAGTGHKSQIIFSGDSDATLTVANLLPGKDTNWWGAGIGAADSYDHSDGIVINSGIIYVGTTSGDDCTAIGGGGNGYGGVTINGGTVTAVSSSSGTAIGGGIGKTSVGGQAKVVINNGKVYAYNFSCKSGYSLTGVEYIPAAAIGGGSSARQTCNPSIVEIHGGYVFARSLAGTAIGGGSSADNSGGNSTITITGGTVDAASMAGFIDTISVKAGAAIGGGTGGTKGNGGSCTLTISGDPVIYTGSIGGGKTINTSGLIGSATVSISGGTLQGQVIMAKGAAADCSFSMTGGTIDNTNAMAGTLNADRDIEFTYGTGTYNTYTFLEENGGAVYVENGTATLSGGTVKNTNATNGGAFYVTGGTFRMTGGRILSASADTLGGAVCVVNGTAAIEDGTIETVSAPNGGAVVVTGGSFTMTGGTIKDFRADENGGAIYVMGGTAQVGGTVTGSSQITEAVNGGAVYVGGGSFEMTGGSITDCSASGAGGAVCVEKTGTVVGTAKISDGTIKNVFAPNGGAVAVTGGSFTMTGGSISGVIASSDGTSPDGCGGAVYVVDGTAMVSGGTITGQADTAEAANGGGVYVEGGSFTMTGGTMENFNVTENGGMVCIHGGSAVIQGGTISGNTKATVDEAARGGAVYISDGGDFTISGEGNIINCNATESGGGVYLAGGSFTVSGGFFEGCTAAGDGGGVYLGSGTFSMDGGEFLSCSAQNGGGVYLGGGTFSMAGGSFESCTAARDGGGVYLSAGTFQMPGGTVQSCTAENGGGAYLAGGAFQMAGGIFETCRATANGGAVCIMNGTASISNGTIRGDNSVDGSGQITPNTLEAVRGGGIYVGGGTLDMSNGTITRCSATSGGAAFITAGHCEMKGGSVSYNYAQNGGGMYVENTPVSYGGLNDITVEWNEAVEHGGGMYILQTEGTQTKLTTITSGNIDHNRAGGNGGGIYQTGDKGECSVSGTSSISYNTATNGGGLYIIGGSTLHVDGGHISGNHAEGTPAQGVDTAYDHGKNVGVGGGVYVGPGTAEKDSVFTMPEGKAAGIYSNTAQFAADDIYANIQYTTVQLPDVSNMQLGEDLTATGWYNDYAAADSHWDENTLLDASKFPNAQAVVTERYRTAVETDTTPYLVEQDLSAMSGKYVCLTIGSNVIKFGSITISKTGSESEDQYFLFRVQAVSLENGALEKPVFEVVIRGNGSVTIQRAPFGSYEVTEVESWSWRYEVNGDATQSVTVDQAETPVELAFNNRIDTDVAYDQEKDSCLWLDGNSQSRINVWNQAQSADPRVLGWMPENGQEEEEEE